MMLNNGGAVKGRNMPAKSRGRRARKGGEPTAAEQRRVVAEMRAFAHPLRLRLFELFAEKPRTTMQVAELLGQPPTRLYHHVNALEKAGLLRLKETRPNRGTVEKYYEIVREAAKPSTAVMMKSAAARQSARAAAGVVFEQARQDLFAAISDMPELGDEHPMLLRMILSTTPTKAAALRKKLLALVNEIREECGGEKETGQRWALTLALAPSWPRKVSAED
jgi:DNA-binding transcriptional ArsR family regulator